MTNTTITVGAVCGVFALDWLQQAGALPLWLAFPLTAILMFILGRTLFAYWIGGDT